MVEATRFELATPCSLVLETRFELAIFSTIPFCHSNKTSALPTALRLEICAADYKSVNSTGTVIF